MQIRPFTPTEYQAIAALHNAACPKDPTTADRIRDWDDNHPSHLKTGRWVAEVERRIVGVGEYTQSPDLYHPHKFQIVVYVLPNQQQQGIGSALYEHVTRQLKQLDPIAFQGRAHEDERDSLAFLQKRGFVEDFRTWESHLDVTSFDPTPWFGLEGQLRERGIRITSLAELSDDPRREREIFDLERATTRDIPSPASITTHRDDATPQELDKEFARYQERVLHHPNHPSAAYFVALTDEECIGLSYHTVDPEHHLVDIEITGVRSDYRRRGIATALKMRGIAWARQHGYHTVRTWNDTANQPMLSINDRLGFTRQPALIFFEKRL